MRLGISYPFSRGALMRHVLLGFRKYYYKSLNPQWLAFCEFVPNLGMKPFQNAKCSVPKD